MICSDIGPRDARIVLIGEAPGEKEENTGRPFSGAAGSLLKSMLSHCGIDFNQCFVTNVMNVRPPDNRFKYFYNDKMPSKHLEAAWTTLQNKVEAVRPDVIIPLGAEPLKALCNKNNISTWRGTWLKFRNINVLPTYHPSYILRVYGDHPIVELDLTKANRNKPLPMPHIPIKPAISDVVQFVNIGIANKLRTAFDIETIGHHVRCLSLAYKLAGKVKSICIPFIRFASSDMVSPVAGSTIVRLQSNSSSSSSYWQTDEEVLALNQVQRLFSSGTEIIGQNSISFDEPLIYNEFGLSIGNHYMDTMHAWHCLYPELPKSLDFLNSTLLEYPNYSANVDHTSDVQEWTYCSMDSIVTLQASYKIESELRGTIV